MQDPTEQERLAIRNAGSMGGEYIDSIGKTDICSMTVDEYLEFVECIVTGYFDWLHANPETGEE